MGDAIDSAPGSMPGDRRPALDRRALGRALTQLANASVAQLLAAHGVQAGDVSPAPPRIGITGPPGSGKSSLGGRLAALRARSARVGMLAIDPSSPRTGGALLGDRIRIDEIDGAEDLFVRSLASRTSADGLAQNLPELLHAMETAGFDEIFIETVGVGQVEHAIRHEVDTLLLVLNPGSGDGIQAMKAGLMELADIYVVNKADLPGASKLASDIQGVLQLSSRQTPGWQPPVLQTSIRDSESIARLSGEVDRHRAWVNLTRDATAVRLERKRQRLRGLLERRITEVVESLPAGLYDRSLATQFADAIERLRADSTVR